MAVTNGKAKPGPKPKPKPVLRHGAVAATAIKAASKGRKIKAELNPRQEAFCVFIAKGTSAFDAYKKAGYGAASSRNAIDASASALLRIPKISKRIAAIQANLVERTPETAASIAAKLERMLVLSEKVKNPAAGVAAIMGMAKIYGLIIDRQQAEVIVARRPSLDPEAPEELSENEWLASLKALSKAPVIDLLPEPRSPEPRRGKVN